jgi:hypothetical protein
VTNATGNGKANGASGPWSTTLTKNTNLMLVPSFCPSPDVTNAIVANDTVVDFANLATNHYHDVWQSVDSSGYEPLGSPTTTPTVGAPINYVDNTLVGTSGVTNYYTHNLDVWLQPGAVDYLYASGNPNPTIYVSNFNATPPNQHINIKLNTGDKNVLVVPGYVVDGLLYDGLDLAYPDNPAYGLSGYPRFRNNNYQEVFMWPDDTTSVNTTTKINAYTTATSLERELMFRNYANLLTGYYVNRPDEPLSTQTEPLDDTTPATQRPLYGLGEYYPSAGFYWPFDDVGVDWDPTYALIDATTDPDLTGHGQARHAAYSINMLSPAAAPEWYGEWFYKSSSGGGTSVVSGSGATSASELMNTKSDWQTGAPDWLLNDFDASGEGIMTNESAHNTNLAVNVWRPATFSGTALGNGSNSISPNDSLNYTGGYVTDGAGNYYRNAMAWSGRPTHYYDFAQAKWVPVANNHAKNSQTLPLCNWKAQEYAWHARAMGVTIYTVGYGALVFPAQQVLLAQIANSTNTTAGNSQTFNGSFVTNYVAGPGTAITYNPSQPIGQQFYATTPMDISNDFYAVGQAINAALTQ